MASGLSALRASPALAQRLQATEAALRRLKDQPAPPDVEGLLPRLGERAKAAIEGLERTVMSDPRNARTEVAEHVGPIHVVTTATEIRLETQKRPLGGGLSGVNGH
jgi:hypothetical protein